MLSVCITLVHTLSGTLPDIVPEESAYLLGTMPENDGKPSKTAIVPKKPDDSSGTIYIDRKNGLK